MIRVAVAPIEGLGKDMGVSNLRTELAASLKTLGRTQSSGTLTLSRPDGRTATIAFVAGSILHASSDSTPRLGDSLVDAGYVSAADLESVLRLQRRKKQRQPLGTILHELGILPREIAQSEIDAQIARVVLDVFTWPRAEFRFEEVEWLDGAEYLPPARSEVDAVLARVAAAEAGQTAG